MTVVREAVIRIRTERGGASGGGFESRAFQAEARAAKESAQETKGATRAVREHGQESRLHLQNANRAMNEYGVSGVRSLGNVGKGALQVTRAFALMSASGEEDTRKLLENLVKIEAATSSLAGGARLAQFAGSFGPVGIAVGAVATAVGIATVVWSRHRAELEENERAAEELATALLKAGDARRQRGRNAGAAERGLSREAGARRTGTAFSDAEQGRRIDAEQGTLQARLLAMAAEDEARIATEAGFRPEFNRPIRGTPARRQRIEARRREELAQPVGPEGFDTARIGNQERISIAERLLQLEREEFQLQQQKLQQKRQAAIEDSQGGLFGFASAEQRTLARSAADANYEAGLREGQARGQKATDVIVGVYEAAARKLQQIENALGN